ncbi:hypothetical protein [Burkholderia ubonensis]|uniref:hypothetical protein n=1 Tax=Burkholderia ubonensis TaxID=101571 RepID=UPI000759EF1E|nr:hypothetical protein [Burkholderia ubonensis]KWB50903.1 hypothetical protein WL36_05020 [Burkholderia ubonensis]
MGVLNELAKHIWAVILLVAVPVGAVVGFLVNVATLRRAARERQKLDLEIAKLQADAKRSARERIRLELEINKLKADADRADQRVVTADLMEMKELVRLRDRLERPDLARQMRKPSPRMMHRASPRWRLACGWS